MPIQWTTRAILFGTTTGPALPIASSGKNSTTFIECSSYYGCSIHVHVRSTTTAASGKGVVVGVYSGDNTGHWDNIAICQQEFSTTPNPGKASWSLFGHEYYRINIAMSSSNDSHCAWASYKRWKTS